MFGWKLRTFLPFSYRYRPFCFEFPHAKKKKFAAASVLFLCMLTFIASFSCRLLEIFFWQNPGYMLNGEWLLATHDAYHWIAGAEGFEFGVGHPMSLMAKWVSLLFQTSAANAGFWLAPVLASLLSVSVFLWGWCLGFPLAGAFAGVLSSLSPAFLARTLFGFYDTDLVILLFPLVLTLIPAMWISPWLSNPIEFLLAPLRKGAGSKYIFLYELRGETFEKTLEEAAASELEQTSERDGSINTHIKNSSHSFFVLPEQSEMQKNIFHVVSMCVLAISGYSFYLIQSIHSFFPYLLRYTVFIIFALIFLLGPRGGRLSLLGASLSFAFPALLGVKGLFFSLAWVALLVASHQTTIGKISLEKIAFVHSLQDFLQTKRGMRFFSFLVISLWMLVFYFIFDFHIFDLMKKSFFSYVDRSGEVVKNLATSAEPLVFPAVAQSIIEVQQVSPIELLFYIYPHLPVVFIAIFSFFFFLLFCPAFFFLLPFVVLAALSVYMGGRMAMFASPVLLLSFALLCEIILQKLYFCLSRFLKTFLHRKEEQRSSASSHPLLLICKGLFLAIFAVIAFLLAQPLFSFIPNITRGPAITQQHAEALSFIKENTPQDAVVWEWWDWGYAVHHFSQRKTIADGARHNGPALYLPALVYSTKDFRFARQLIKYTANLDNDPKKVFEGLGPEEATALLDSLADSNNPLITSQGKQYIVVSFELVRLGVWVSKFGSWDFIGKTSSADLVNNLSVGLQINLDTGQVLSEPDKPVQAQTITLFTPEALVQKKYANVGPHFMFCSGISSEHFDKNALDKKARHFDKLVVGDSFYQRLMSRLLVADPNDPMIRPYFKLVFTNNHVRVYEVL